MEKESNKQGEKEEEYSPKEKEELLSAKQDDSITLPSAKLMLSVVQKENDYEIDRKKTLETRSGIFVAFSGVLFTFVTKSIDLSIFQNVSPTDFIVYAILFVVFYLLLVAALYSFIHVIVAKKYDRLKLTGFDEETAKMSEEQVALYLMNIYSDVIKTNAKVNDKKSIYFLVGVISTGVASVLIIGMYLISFILTRG